VTIDTAAVEMVCKPASLASVSVVHRKEVEIELILWLGLGLAYFRKLCKDRWTPKLKL